MKLIYAVLVAALGTLFAAGPIARAGQKSQTNWTSSDKRKYDFALVTEGGKSVSNWGDMGSFDTDSLRRRTKADTLYVRKDGGLYAITDPSTISQSKAAMEPMTRIGKEMSEVGHQQGLVGKDQGKLGAQEGELGRQMSELGLQLGEEARKSESTKETEAKMKALSEKMKDLGKQMAASGEKQKPYGNRLKELGHQMGEAGKEAESKITKLIDNAFDRGLAHKV